MAPNRIPLRQFVGRFRRWGIHAAGHGAVAFVLAEFLGVRYWDVVKAAAAGLIVGAIFYSGLAVRFSNSIIDLAQGSQELALVLAMFICILLGMGVTVMALYDNHCGERRGADHRRSGGGAAGERGEQESQSETRTPADPQASNHGETVMASFFPSLRNDGAQLKDIQAPFSEIYKLWGQFSQALMRGPGPLSVADRELIATYTSGVNACTYCYHDHTMAAEHFGIEPAVFESLIDDVESAPIDGKMKPLLRYVGKLTASPSKLTQADADAVFDAGWSESELHFAILVSARFNCINRLVQGHGIEHSAAIGDSWKTEQGLTYSILELKGT